MTDVQPPRPTGVEPEVAISVPASSAYLSVLRTAAAGLGARLDFTVDDLEDLRVVVDEACAVLLEHALPGSVLSCRLDPVLDPLNGSVVVVTGEVGTGLSQVPARSGYAWTVLEALASDVRADLTTTAEGRRLSVTVTANRAGLS